MKALKILIIYFLFPLVTVSQKTEDSIIRQSNIRDKEILELRNKIEELESQYNYQEKNNEITLNSISNQIGAASYNLTVFGILFGIAALGLGLYVTYIERKIVNLGTENSKLLEESISVKNEVVEINEKIQDDIYGLFRKIKREETTSILNRLCNIPSDIPNVIKVLFSRELVALPFLGQL